MCLGFLFFILENCSVFSGIKSVLFNELRIGERSVQDTLGLQ